MRGEWTENSELWPDVEVHNAPVDYINGRDPQLERAVKVLMEE